jgi:hypothetical protein
MSHAVTEAWRGLVRHRAFGGFVIAIMALGAGSATALAGLMDVWLVRAPPHVADYERLVKVNGAWLIGAVAATLAADWIRSLLCGVEPGDQTTFALASLVVALAGIAGSVLPALRAAAVDPVVALRAD